MLKRNYGRDERRGNKRRSNCKRTDDKGIMHVKFTDFSFMIRVRFKILRQFIQKTLFSIILWTKHIRTAHFFAACLKVCAQYGLATKLNHSHVTIYSQQFVFFFTLGIFHSSFFSYFFGSKSALI